MQSTKCCNCPRYGWSATSPESGSAPGISVSGYYKWFGRVQLGSVASGDDAQLGLDMSIWSFRAGVSKSFVAIGLAFTVG